MNDKQKQVIFNAIAEAIQELTSGNDSVYFQCPICFGQAHITSTLGKLIEGNCESGCWQI